MLLGNIPVNLITGFLGAGKTTFIKSLLASKPAGERWAVLVNEFGEIGLDGALLGGLDEVTIREVPGGCLCCAAGVPTRVAIAQLLRKAKPHRLLIEPTGLGHPANILKTLLGDEYHGVLTVKSSLCLVDPRNLADKRYREHELFNQQLEMADLVLASKADCYGEPAIEALKDYLADKGNLAPVHAFSQDGEISPALLESLNSPSDKARSVKEPSFKEKSLKRIQSSSLLISPKSLGVFDAPEQAVPIPFNEQGFIRKPHEGEGVYACGWCFSPEWSFNFEALMAMVEATPSLRLKAVMITFDGILAINRLEQELQLSELDDALDSRIEFISRESLDWDAIEKQILSAGARQTAG